MDHKTYLNLYTWQLMSVSRLSRRALTTLQWPRAAVRESGVVLLASLALTLAPASMRSLAAKPLLLHRRHINNEVITQGLPRMIRLVVRYLGFKVLSKSALFILCVSGDKNSLSGGWGQPLPTSVGRTLSTPVQLHCTHLHISTYVQWFLSTFILKENREFTPTSWSCKLYTNAYKMH